MVGVSFLQLKGRAGVSLLKLKGRAGVSLLKLKGRGRFVVEGARAGRAAVLGAGWRRAGLAKEGGRGGGHKAGGVSC